MPVGGLDVSETSTKLRGQRAYATARGIGRMRGLKAYGKTAIAAQTGVGGVGYTQLPDGQYVLDVDLQELKREWAEGYEILTKQGFDAYNKAITEAQEQGKVTSALKAKYQEALKYKKPLTGRWQPPEKPSFKHITLVVTGDIPGTPGFYSVTDTSIKADKDKNETHETTTFVFARLEDGSLSLVDKKSTTKTYPPEWVSTPGVMGSSEAYEGRDPNKPPPGYEKGFKKVKTGWGEATEVVGGWYPHSQAVKLKSLSPYGTVTHEQRRGASKLAPILAKKEGKDYTELSRKEKQEFYQTALGLASASGYVDKDAIVKVDPKTLQPVKPTEPGIWASYTPEVASALGKLKSYLKPDGDYDWARIITLGTTQEVIAASKLFNIDKVALQAVKRSIKEYPPLGEALSEDGWEGYSKKVEEIRILSQKEFDDWVNNEAPPEIRDKYQKAGEGDKGYEAIKDDLAKMNEDYAEFKSKVASGEIMALPDGNYIAKSDFDEMPKGTQGILKENGFEGLPDYFVQDYFENKEWDTTPPSDKPVSYQKIGYGEMEIPIYSEEYTQYHERKAEATRAYVDKFGNKGLMERGGAQVLGLIFPPAKTISPEFAIADISGAEWALGGINVALIGAGFVPGALLGSAVGRGIIYGLSSTGAGIIGYETAKNWGDLTSPQKVMGVGGALLYALPIITTVPSVTKTGIVRVTSPTGEVGWKGLAALGKPIIGKSGGKWVLFSNVDVPPIWTQKVGWEPGAGLAGRIEVQLYRTQKALEKAGVPLAEQEKLLETLGLTKAAVARGKSPVTPKTVTAAEISSLTLDEDGALIVLQQIIKYKKQIEKAVFGSGATAPQLTAEARAAWAKMGRQVGDFDVQSTMALEQAKNWVKETYDLLIKAKGASRVRMAEGNPYLVEAKGADGQWHHYIDFKTKEPTPGSPVAAEGAYGIEFAKPAVKVKIPDVGTVNILRLDEQSLRKMASILETRSISGFKELSQEQIVRIFKSGLSSDEQIAAVRALLNPETAKVFDAYMLLAKQTKGFKTSLSMLDNVDFTKVKGINSKQASDLLVWARGHVNDIRLDGSGAVYHQLKGMKGRYTPADLDFTLLAKSKYTMQQARQDLTRILGKDKVGKLIDIHPEGQFGTKLPFGWKYQPDVIVDGVRMTTLQNQLLDKISTITAPGVKESFGLMGPTVEAPLPKMKVRDVEIGTHAGRIKDIERANVISLATAKAYKAGGAIKLASEIEDLVKFVKKAPTGKATPAKLPDDAIVFGPQAHRVKDIIDEYAIFYTYHGKEVADKWAKLWENLLNTPATKTNAAIAQLKNKVGNINSKINKLLANRSATNAQSIDKQLKSLATDRETALAQLKDLEAGVIPKIQKEITAKLKKIGLSEKEIAELTMEDKMLILSSYDPASGRFFGFELSFGKVPKAKSPSISITTPLAVSLPSISPSFSKKVSSPISYKLSPKSPIASPSPSLSPSLVSPSVSPYPSPSPSPSVSPYPSVSPSPSPSLRVSPSPSPSIASKISPSPSPSPTPSPVPTPTPSPKPSPKPSQRISTSKDKGRRSYEGAVAWAQGELKRGKKLVTQYKVWSRPFRQDDLESFDEGELPPGVKIVPGISSAYETVQQFRGKVAPGEEQIADVGAFVATVHQPEAKPGKAGAIKFKRDIPTSKIRGESTKGLSKLPMHTTLEQLIQIVFKSTEAQVERLGVGTLEAMGMEAKEAKTAKPSAKVRFAKSRLAEKLEKASHSEIVSAIKNTGLTTAETKELLRMLPDRERQQFSIILSEPSVYAPTRGMPKAEYKTAKLRRKKSKSKRRVAAEPMLVGARL